MIARAPRLAAAAAALALAWGGVQVAAAERAYEAGVAAADPRTGAPASDRPDADVPGRLERYLEAHTRVPQALYALRAGQILLHRATARPRPQDADRLLADAARLLRRAAADAPLDSRIHDALSHASAAAGDLPAALRHARLAVLTGPRRLSTLGPGTARALWSWHRTHDPAWLAVALDAARCGYDLVDRRDPALVALPYVPAAALLVDAVQEPGGPSREDLEDAVRTRPDLAAVAARVLADAAAGR